MKQFSLFLIITSLVSCFGAEPQKTGKEGSPLPEFKLLGTDSITWINTRDIPSGKPIVLFYFTPNCPYCKAMTKSIIENIDNLKNIQFYFITNSRLSALKTFDKEYQLGKYSNITSVVDNSNAVSDYFEISGYPYLAIYGKDKKLNKSFLGKIYSTQLKKAAEE